MARSTGIEITETSVRVVELDGSARKCRVAGAAEVPIAVDEDGKRGPDQIQQAVRGAFKGSKARRDQVILGIPASRAIIREILIPFTDEEQIRKVIKFESESHLPSGNIEDVVVGFHKIAESGPRSRVLIMAVHKDTLKEYLEILGRSGVDPAAIDLDAAALFSRARLIPGLDGEDEASTQVILDVGETTTTVIVASGEHLRMVRCMRLGAETLTRTLSHDLGIDRAEARTVTQSILRTSDMPFATAGEVEAREPGKALTAVQLRQDIIKDKENDFARRIVNEIRRSLSSVQLEGRIAGIWLTGSASRAAGLERELADTFGVPVRPLDVLNGMEPVLPPGTANWTGVPIGLALKGLDHDVLGLDFRQEELRFTRKFEKIRNPLLFAEALLLVLVVFLGIIELNHQNLLKSNLRYCADEAVSNFKELIVDRAARDPSVAATLGYDKPDDAERTLQQIRRSAAVNQVSQVQAELRTRQKSISDNYGVNFEEEENSQAPELQAKSAVQRLDQFLGCFSRAKDKIGRFTIDRLDVQSTSISWSMKTTNSDAFTFLKDEFDKLPEYVNAEAGSTSTRGEWTVATGCRLEFKPER